MAGHSKGSVFDSNVGYNTKTEGYAASMLYITKLSEIAGERRRVITR